MEEHWSNLQAYPAGEGSAARPVDYAWTQDNEFKSSLLPILPKELFLPQLGMRVGVPKLRMVFQRRPFVDPGTPAQWHHPVDVYKRQYQVTPSKTMPVDCTVDPDLKGKTYEVGPSRAYKTIQSVPWASLKNGSTVRIHNEDTTGAVSYTHL